MPRGVYERKDSPTVSSMTAEELKVAEERVVGKVSPFNSRTVVKNGIETVIPATPIRAAHSVDIQTSDGHIRKAVGVFTKPAKMGDSGTLKRFAHIPSDRTGWIEMTFEQAAEYEQARVLVAYDPDEGLGLISRAPTPIPEKKGV